MWWNGQNLDLTRTDRTGQRWHFRVWHDQVDGTYIQRVFFWNEGRSETGVLELIGERAVHRRRLKDVIHRLVARADFRGRHLVNLEFPVEKKYATYLPLA